MGETDFILLWKEQYEKIDQSLVINKQLLKETLVKKMKSSVASFIRVKLLGIVTAIIFLLLLGAGLFYAVANYSSAANYFIVSTGAIFLINFKALYDYLKHLVLLERCKYDGNIMDTQGQLIKLQLSIVQNTRFMFLQLPFWTTFYLSNEWFPTAAHWIYIVFQVLLTGLFTWLAYWLYKNITFVNLKKRWVNRLVNGSGGKYVVEAMQFNNEMEQFKQF